MVKLDLNSLQNKQKLNISDEITHADDIISKSETITEPTVSSKIPTESANKRISLSNLVKSSSGLSKIGVMDESENTEEQVVIEEIIEHDNLTADKVETDESLDIIITPDEKIEIKVIEQIIHENKNEANNNLEKDCENVEIFSNSEAKIENIETEDEFFPNFDIMSEFSLPDDEFLKNNNIAPNTNLSETVKQPIITEEIVSVTDKINYTEKVKGFLSGNRKNHGLRIFKKKVLIPMVVILIGLFGIIGNGLINSKSSIIEHNVNIGSGNGLNVIEEIKEIKEFKEGTDFKILKNTKKNIKNNKAFSGVANNTGSSLK